MRIREKTGIYFHATYLLIKNIKKTHSVLVITFQAIAPPPPLPILRPFVRHCIEKKIDTYFLLNDITAVKVKVAISFLLKKNVSSYFY